MNRNNKISSSTDDVLARVQQLSQRAARQSSGCFWIEGIRPFVQAFDAKYAFDTVVYSPVLLTSPLAEMLIRRLAKTSVPRVRVSPEQFRRISSAERVSGVGAILRQRWSPLECAEPTQGLCWIVIEDLRSTGNLGTILRTAEAIDAGGIIFVGPRCDPFDPVVARSSMGGLLHLPLVRTTHEKLARWLTAHDVKLVGLSPSAERLWTELPDKGPIAIAIGEERNGLSDRLWAICHICVRLPMSGRADSLNVGVAAGVAFYELVRRAHNATHVDTVEGIILHKQTDLTANRVPDR